MMKQGLSKKILIKTGNYNISDCHIAAIMLQKQKRLIQNCPEKRSNQNWYFYAFFISFDRLKYESWIAICLHDLW